MTLTPAPLAILLLALLPLPAPVAPPPLRPAHIILIRHAEKPADPHDPHLSPAGVRRAGQLVQYVVNDPAMKALGQPVAIFATRTTRDDDGQRTQETVAPLARALKLTVQVPFHGKDYMALARMILSDPAYAGRTVLICWNHEEIPQLVAAFGIRPRPAKWKASVFDVVYVVSYHKGNAVLTASRYGGR